MTATLKRKVKLQAYKSCYTTGFVLHLEFVSIGNNSHFKMFLSLSSCAVGRVLSRLQKGIKERHLSLITLFCLQTCSKSSLRQLNFNNSYAYIGNNA